MAFASHIDQLADARNRAAVEECAAVMVASVVQRALSGGDEDDAGAAVSEQAGGSSVSVTASPYVTQIAMRLLAACDAADYEGTTTWEAISGSRITYLRRGVSRFNLGPWRNLHLFVRPPADWSEVHGSEIEHTLC
jgi:hypothetical protein